MKRLSMTRFYSDLSTDLLKLRLAEFNKQATLSIQEADMKVAIEQVLIRRGEFDAVFK